MEIYFAILEAGKPKAKGHSVEYLVKAPPTLCVQYNMLVSERQRKTKGSRFL